jgi:hypothetical protein
MMIPAALMIPLPLGLLLLALAALLAVWGSVWRKRRRRSQLRRSVWTPMAEHLESTYRARITTRAPLLAWQSEAEGWLPMLPSPDDPRPEWQAQSGDFPEVFAAYQRFVADYAKLAAELAGWLTQEADALRSEVGRLELPGAWQPRALAYYLYLRLNGLTQSPPQWRENGHWTADQLMLAQNLTQPQAASLHSQLETWLRERLGSYMPYRDRITKLQVMHDRLIHHLQALGETPRPFGVKPSPARGGASFTPSSS